MKNDAATRVKLSLSLIKRHRVKKGLCQQCGVHPASEVNHTCIENYISADMREYSKVEIIKKLSADRKEIEVKKEIISPVKYESSFDYICIENFNSNLEFDIIANIAHKYKNLTVYLMCVKSFSETLLPLMFKTNKAFNVSIRYIDKMTDVEIDRMIFSAYKVYSSIPNIIEKCRELKKKYIELPDCENLNMKIIKDRFLEL